MLRVLALAALLAPTLLSAQAAGPPEITTVGTAEVHLTADRALLHFSVQTAAPTAATAASRNGQQVRIVQAALERLGYRGENARAIGFGVTPNYDYREGRKLVDYRATTQIDVMLRDLDKMGAVVDAGLGAGATEVAGMEFLSDSVTAGRQRAIGLAFANARAEAQALAAAAGGRLGAIRSMSSEVQREPVPMVRAMAMSAQAGAPNVERDVVVAYRVQVRWIYEP